MFKYLFHFLSGYVIIKIEGKNTEQLLNRCVNERLPLCKLKRHGREFATAEISPKLYYRLKLYARDCDCKIRIIRRMGFPFLLQRLKRRKAFCFFGIFAVIILVWLCSRIWVINILETDPVKKHIISEILKDNGIVCGMPRSMIDSEALQQEVLVRHSEYTRFWAEAKGTRLTVDVRYSTPYPPLDPTDKVSNIVAKKNGIIRKIVVRRGEAAVTEGMSVTQGQLLVSGITHINNHGDLYVYSDADVIALTSYSLTDSVPLEFSQRIKTGKSTKKYCINAFGKDFNLFFKTPGYTHYDGEITEKNLRFFGEYFLPLKIRVYSYNEVKPTPVSRTVQEAEELLKSRLTTLLHTTAGEENVLESEFTVNVTGKTVTVTLNAKCLENIAAVSEISYEDKPFLREDITPQAIKNTQE